MMRFVVGLAMWMVFAACSSNPDPGYYPVDAGRTGCAVGDVLECSCQFGIGHQTCDAAGSYGACVCPAFDAGFDTGSPCSAGQTLCNASCTDTRTDSGNCGACGRACASGSICTGGACVPSPVDRCPTVHGCESCAALAGCGWCGPGPVEGNCVQVNASCTGPASGACGVGWACRPTECAALDAPTNECSPCNGACSCGIRNCDGTAACRPTNGGTTCDTIGGVACPAVAMYRRCTADAQCGPRMRCAVVYPGQTERVCRLPCTDNAQCPSPPAGSVAVSVCSTVDGMCTLGCQRAGACDTDLSCRVDITGHYGFCL